MQLEEWAAALRAARAGLKAYGTTRSGQLPLTGDTVCLEVQVSSCDTGLGAIGIRAWLLRFNISRAKIAAAPGAAVSTAFDFIRKMP